MTTHEWSVEWRGEKITAVLHEMGNDCVITLSGGQREHVGAISVCPASGEVQTTVFEGHKEQFITEPWCRRVHELTGGAAVVTAGIHYDHLSKQEIAEVMDAAADLWDKIESFLRTQFPQPNG